MGRLPLAVADVGVVVARGAAPIDAGQALALGIGTELPEILADAALAAAMPAGDHGVGDPLGLDQTIRHQACALPCARQGRRCPKSD